MKLGCFIKCASAYYNLRQNEQSNQLAIMADPLKPPYVFLLLGDISISAAAIFTVYGKVWVRFNGWVYRKKEPRVFWGEVAIYFLAGVWFVGYFLYQYRLLR